MDAPRESETADREIVVERVFEAPCALVWEAWTNPEHIVHWWGPDGFTTTIEKMDFRVGGEWKHTMHGPDGTDYPNSSVFHEIVDNERIVFVHGGRRTGGPEVNFTATWTFEAVGNRTRLTMRLLFDTPAGRELAATEFGAVEGARQTLAKLGGFLAQRS